jgi:nucleotide-binding universal stress UspA family protein
MFTRLLVCSDGSEQARNAARAAAEIARRFQADITLLSVFYPSALMMPFASAPEAAPQMEVVMELGEEMHTHIQQETGKVLTEAGVPFQPRREFGHPVDTIVAAAQDLQADLIVLGSRGLSAWKALLLGSVSDGVLHHAPCPVLIVRGERTTFPRVLLASDGSAGAYKATLTAGALARKFEAPLIILNVLEPLGPLSRVLQGEVSPESCSLQARAIVAQRIRTVAEQADASYILHQEVGHPAETIVRYARENDCPLIVIGSRGMSSLKSFAVGSVSDRVAQHAHGSVLVVR